MTAVATAPGPAPAKSFRDVWLISIGHSLTHWYPATFYLLLPLIGRELGLSYSEIGFIMTCQYVAGAVSNIPGGMVVDTVGRQGLLMAVSLFWIGFPYFLMSFTHSYWVLLLCVMLVGIGNNLWHPTAIPMLAQRFPQQKGLALSFHSMGGNVGDALAPLAVGALLAFMSWRNIVILNVIPGVLMAFLILYFLGTLRVGSANRKERERAAGEKHEGQSVKEYFRGFSELLKNRELLMLSVGSGFRSMTQNGLLTFLPVFLAYEMGYSPFWVGVCMFVLQASGFGLRSRAGRRTTFRPVGPAPHTHDQHADDRRDTRVHGVRRPFACVCVLHRRSGFFPLCNPAGTAGLDAGVRTEEDGRHQHRHALRGSGSGVFDRARHRGRAGGPLRAHGRVCLSGSHDRCGQPVHLLHAVARARRVPGQGGCRLNPLRDRGYA